MRSSALATLLLLLAGCDYDPRGLCEASADCARGQVCAGGVCTVPAPAPLNEAPVALPDAYTVVAGQPFECPADVGLLANDWDPDPDDELVAERVDPASSGWVFVEPSGAFRYQPMDGFTGIATFTYRASDGALPSAVTTVTLTVAAAP
jgi:large repetitive protein